MSRSPRSSVGPPIGKELRALFGRFRRIQPDMSYYLVGIGLSGANGAEWRVQTYWEGWLDSAHRIERRVARCVDPYWMVESWRQSSLPYFVVNDAAGLAVFLAFSGNALIAAPVAEAFLPDVIKKLASHDGDAGFRTEQKAPGAPEPASDSPAPRHVAAVNGRRCALCGNQRGRRPRVLRQRPIRPLALGGTPASENFISLCPSCDAQLWNGALDALPAAEQPVSSNISPYLEMRQYRDWLAHHSESPGSHS